MERIEGLTIDLALDSTRLNRGLTGLKDKLKTVNSEMKANLSAFSRADNSIAKHETKLNGLQRKLEVQKEVVKGAREHYQKMVQEYGEGSKKADAAARSYNNQVSALNNLERNVNETRDALEHLREEQRIQESSWGRMGQRLEETGNRLTKIGDKMKTIGKNMSMYVTAPIVGVGGLAVKTGIEFEEGMSKVAAVSGATGDDLKALEKQARDLGAATQFSAKEAADGMQYLALAGFKTKDIMAAMPGMLDLAAAGSLDLGRAADIVSDTMQAMGLSADKAGHASDVFAYAQANANTNVEQMGEALKYSAPAAHAFGWSLEETSAATMALANSGLKGSIAGQAFASSLTRLAKPTEKMGKLWASTNSEFFDAEGNLKSMPELVKELENATKDMTQEQRAGYLATTFGAEAYKHWVILLEAGSDELGNMTKNLENSDGAASKMAKTMNDNAKGDIKTFYSALQELGIQIYDIVQPALRSIIQTLTGVTQWVQKLSPKLKLTIAIFAGIVAAIGPLLVIGGLFVGFLGNVALGLSRLFPSIERAGGLLKWLRLGLMALTGPVGIVIGVVTLLSIGFIALYKKSETFRNGVHNLIGKLKELGGKVLEGLKTALGAVVSFFKDQLDVLKQFWKENGDVIIQAVKNIGSVISAVFKAIWKVIKFIMPAVLAIIKSIWGNIKGVITGALDVIMGLVKVFAGLFTGDFSKMWEGVKQLFSGALEFIWNFMQLMFWGKMLKGILSLGKLLVNAFKSMWSGIKNIFSTVIKWVVDFVKNRFTAMRNNVNTITKGIKNVISTIWNGIWSFFKTIIKAIYDFIRGRFTAVRDTIKTIFTTVRSTTQTIWNGIKDKIINPVKNTVSSIKTRFTDMKNQITSIFTSIRTKVSEIIGKMVETVKGMPKRMGDGLKKTAGKIGDGIKAVANKMTETLGKGVNGVIGGVNWVLDKVGVSSKISEWKIPQYAKGTDGHPGGLAIVGDGKGSNAGQELIQTPDGKQFLSPDKPSLVNLPKGTHVLSATMTRKLLDIPQYGWGTLKEVWNKGKKAVTKIKDSALDVWQYISNPSKLFNKALKLLGVETPSMPGILEGVGTGTFSKVKESMKDYLKNKIEDFSSVPAAGTGVQKWAGVASRALAMTGQYSKSNLERLLYQMQTESGGNPRAINLWDINAKNGTPSKGLMQVIDPTFKAYAMSGYNKDIYDPLSNIIASIRYAVSRYGSLAKAYRGVGYATGGLIKNEGLYRLAEGGFPEWVIPTDPSRRTDAMKLLALAGKDIGNKRPNQLKTPSYGSMEDSIDIVTIIRLLQEQVQLLTTIAKDSDSSQPNDSIQTVSLLTRIALAIEAGQSIQIGGKEIAKVTAKDTDKFLNGISDRRKAAWGG
ncbi:phage tail tape measure protein [Niallia circulans]|uniref:phage tail tape measure protein n=1 Tax=Niallia circulans TaxID=1397 RepID=UPI003D958D41